jgi:hypothetical protein
VEHARTQFDSDDTTSSGELSLHIAKFQADTVICYRLVHGHSHIAVTTDTDYQVLAGEQKLCGVAVSEVRTIAANSSSALRINLKQNPLQ